MKHFGEEFDVIEREVQRHLTGKRMKQAYRDPYVNQTHYVVSVTYKRARVYYTKAGIALSPTAAREWTEKQREAAQGGRLQRPHRHARVQDGPRGAVPHAEDPELIAARTDSSPSEVAIGW